MSLEPGQYKDILESVLGEKLQFEEEELAEKPASAVRLRKHISPIHDHLQELLQMRQKLQVGRDVSYMLHQLFRDLLTNNEPDSSQWLSFRKKLDQGGKLAECLYHKLQSESPEAAAGEEELPLEARFYRPEQEAETVKEVLRDTVDERYLAPSSLPDLPGSLGPGRSGGFLFDDYKLDLAVDEAQSPEAAAGEEELPLEARFYRPEQEAETVKEVLRDTVDERYLAPSSLPDLPGSLGPGRSGGFLFDDYKLDLAVDEAQSPEAAAGEEELPLEARFYRPEQEAETVKEVLRDTVDERYLAPSSLPDLPGSLGPGRSGGFLFDDYKLDLAVDEAQSPEAAAGEEELPLEARFYRPEQEAETVKEVLRDTVDERYLAPSSLPDLPGSLGPGRSGGFLFDDYKLDLAVDEAPPCCDAYHPGPLIGHMSHPISYMQGLQLQLTPSPLVNNCLQLQLQRQWDSGDYRARFSPFSTIWSFTANNEPANKWSSVQGMKTSPKVECDSLENPVANNHGCQVIGHTDDTSALKEKILKRKLLLSKRKLACRFPGLHAQTEILSSAGKMLLI
ncbi:NBPF family member NBPF4-like [Dasypus novemcinctus]|uniref:NBPF family member NBPF4-like n=1 Tax=Dasypus novemcinctus TaxID=9361 RepID=UPI00265E8CAC|nr:neuroblastoma breakpoint family member 4-like [Dasypus novemcinctus]